MRISIREQLAALVLLTTLTGLAVLSIATWVTNYNRVVTLRTQHLGLTASLKASQLSSNLDLMERSVRSLGSRARLQTALQVYNSGNSSATAAFTALSNDFQAALAAGNQEVLTLQAMIFPNNGTTSSLSSGLLNVTGSGINVQLPYDVNGTVAYLGNVNGGYPPNLYPNFTFTTEDSVSTAHFLGEPLSAGSSILLGPWQTNQSFALCSITLPVVNLTSSSQLLGWITVVLDARLILQVLQSPVGLGKTGTMLLIGPNTIDSRFPSPHYNTSLPITSDVSSLDQTEVVYKLPPNEPYTPGRHSKSAYGKPSAPFNITTYSAAWNVMTVDQEAVNNAGGQISTRNEEGYSVAVGYAVPQTGLCDWGLILEQAHSEAWIEINRLRRVIIGCILGTMGGMILLIFPIAHYSSRPIRRLRDATAKSLRSSPGAPATAVNAETEKASDTTGSDPGHNTTDSGPVGRRKRWPLAVTTFGKSRQPSDSLTRDPESLKKTYPIPETVQVRKHFIQDELSDLTQYFNEMSDELVLHYGKLEERVRLRTAELETSKKAAEVANESKTLFIANISHELKTPLNGILGMCAVAMQENDPTRIKKSLEIIYKSGDLLHNLLTDLLTFSKNQAGQALTLDEREFHIRDIGSQINAIFETQAKEGQVAFSITYEGTRDALGATEGDVDKSYGPPGTGRVKDMTLWGDYHRILQVVINLVSNSLKFTPAGGSVKLTMRCCQEVVTEDVAASRRSSEAPSTASKTGRFPRLRILSRHNSEGKGDENGSIRSAPADMQKQSSLSSVVLVSDPTGNTTLNGRTLRFEFIVEDTGPGIAKHLQQKIFEPFVQGDLRLTKKFGGTGLGLSICSQLAKLMSGSIQLHSEEGVGSRFQLRIPLQLVSTRRNSDASSILDASRSNSITIQRNENVAPPIEIQMSPTKSSFETDSKPRLVGLSQPYFSSAKAPLSSPGSETGKKESKLKILVAEDNKVNQEVVLRMLRLEEIFDVHLAKDGQEAYDKVKESMEAQSPYDLCIIDVQMPVLDGRQATRLIRQAGFTAPIVALTAFTDEINKKECLDSGMDYFLAKPLRRPALKHVLNTYCPPIQEVDEGESVKSPGLDTSKMLESARPPMTPRTVECLHSSG